MKRNIKSFMLLPLAVGMLTGCGKDNFNGITIKFWHTFGQTIQDALTEKINLFTKAVKEHDGVDVRIQLVYQGNYDDVAKKISDGYSVGNRPNISVAYPDNVSDYLGIGKSVNKEFVVNLDSYINNATYGFGKESWLGDQYDETDFVEDFYNEGKNYSVEGTYSLPFMKSTEIMFYNLDLVKSAMPGYRPEIGNSETQIANYMKNLDWDEFMNFCTYIKEHMSEIHNELVVPLYYDSDANFVITKLFQNKIPYSSITAEGTGTIEFGTGENRQKTIDMLTELNTDFKNGLFTTRGIVNKYGSDYFTNSKCVFSVGSSGGSGYNFPQADAFEIGVCRVPHSNNNPLYVSQGPTLAIFSDDGLGAQANEQTKLYSWKFVKFITNAEINAQMCLRGSEGYAPVRTSAYETALFQEFMEEGENYAKCYKVIVDDINVDAGYLVSKCFKGSAALRDEIGSMFTAAIQVADTSELSGLIDTCISNARQKF